jgi:indolepyruvate ferredoxin oxidoreductase alpha subunit
MKQTEAVLRREVARPEPSVIITKAPCALLPEHRRKQRPVYEVIADLCTGCKACSRLGCPAIEWVPFTPEEAAAAGKKATQKGMARISPLLCDGCNQCPPLCKFQAILEKKP